MAQDTNPYAKYATKPAATEGDNPYAKYLAPESPAPTPKVRPSRTMTEAVTDTGRALASGVGGVVKGAGSLGGLVTGNMDNAVTRLGESVQDYWQEGQSDALKHDKAARSAAIDAADGVIGKGATAIKETLSNPSLFVDTVAETAASFIPAGAAGRVGAVVAGSRALGKGATAAQAATHGAKVGTAAGIGTGAVQQAAEVTGDTYGDAMGQADEKWQENPAYTARVAAGENPETVKQDLALSASRAAFAPAAAISVASQFLPGGATLERTIAGAASKVANKSNLAARGINAAKGVVGEGGQEAIEEGGGAFVSNLMQREYTDPTRALDDGVGEAGGMGFVGGAGLGGVAGAAQRPRTLEPAPVQPPNAPEEAELLALPPPGAITVTPDGVAIPVTDVDRGHQDAAKAKQEREAAGLSTDVNAARAAHPGAAPNAQAMPDGAPIPAPFTEAAPVLPDGSPIPDPANGPLSRATNVGMETGAVQQAASLQQAQADQAALEQAAKNGITGSEMPPASMDPATGELVQTTDEEIRAYVNDLIDRGNRTPAKVLAQAYGRDPTEMRDLIVSVRDERKRAALATSAAATPAADAPAGPAAQPTVVEEVSDAIAAPPAPRAKLPTELAKAAPRYSYGDKKFELDFASDADRAAYIAAQDAPSKRDADYLAFAMDAIGLDEAGVRARGREIRDSIKAMAKDAEPGRLALPAFDGDAPAPSTGKPARYTPAKGDTVTVTRGGLKGVTGTVSEYSTNGLANVVVDDPKKGGVHRVHRNDLAKSAPASEGLQAAADVPFDTTVERGNNDGSRNARTKQDAGIQGVAERGGSVPQSEQPVAPQLRGEGDQSASRVGSELPVVPRGSGQAPVAVAHAGEDGQRPGLPAGERPLGDAQGAGQQPAQDAPTNVSGRNQITDSVGRNDRAGAVGAAVPAESGRDDGRGGADDAAPPRAEASGSGNVVERPPVPKVQHATPDALITVRDIYGASFLVKQSELDGARKMLPTYSKDGTRRETTKGPTNLHRENIATDEQIADHNKDAKLVSRRGARNEREEGFSSPEVVTREIKRLGQNPADFEIKRHHGGYVGVRKAAADPAPVPAQAHPKSTAPEHVIPEGGITPMTPEQIKQVASEWRAHIDGGGDAAVTRVFDAPQERDRVRLEKSAGVTSAIENGTRVYHREGGWMTLEQAAARVAEWRDNALSQGGPASVSNGNSQKVVLSLFDKTGSWALPWEEAGYQVYTFDIQNDPDIGDVNNFSMEHFIENFGMFEGNEVYAVLAACPCTDFAVSGSRHFAGKDDDGRTQLSVQLVNQTLATVEYFKPPVWAIENPVGRIEKLTGLPPWTVAFDPFHVGPHPYTKRTQLWGRMNGKLPTAPVEPTQGSKMHSQYGGKSQKTKDARSETPEGFAYAFFQANNAVDHPVMAIANRFDRLDRDLIAKAVNAGFTEAQVAEAVEDDYYDLNDDAANAAIQELIDTAPEVSGGQEVATTGRAPVLEAPPVAPQRSRAEVVANLRQMRQGSSYPVNGVAWHWVPGGKFSDGNTTIDMEKLADAIVAGRDPGNVDALEGEFTKVEPKPDKALLIPRRSPNGGVSIEVQPVNNAPSSNTIFTEDAAEAARAVLRAKLGQLNTGIDPEIMQAGITLAGYHIEKGARTFAAYTKAMVADLGDAIRPYLKSWYMGVKFDPRAIAFDGMDSAASVESAEIEAQSTQEPAAGATSTTEETQNVRRAENQPGDRAGGVQRDQREQPAQERDDDAAADLGGRQRSEAQGDGGRGRADADAQTPAPGGAGSRVRRADPQRAPDNDRVPADGRASPDAVAPKTDLTITGELDFTGVGAVGKFKQNLAAIALLKTIESQDRRATPAEQSVLAKYVGWGGLPQAFRHPTSGKIAKGWDARVAELEAAMTAEEIAAAGRSTQDAHYTSATIVSAIWSAVERMGFNAGRVLEPSMGTGNFFGLMPTELRGKSNLTGVELDSITGRIAKQLYQTANVQVRGFNDIRIAPGSFDLAIGNPPFGAQSIHDTQYPELSKASIHNFFFAKSIASLRPGGVLAMVVSSSFLDANTSTTRAWVAERAKLLGAIRLPQTAFMANAGTNVTTDIVFLQRVADGEKTNGEAWVKVGAASDKGNHFQLNRYYLGNPEMMLGSMVMSSHNTRGNGSFAPVLEAHPGVDMAQALNQAIEQLPKAVYKPAGKSFTEAAAPAIKADKAEAAGGVPNSARVYGYFVDANGALRQRLPDYNGEVQSLPVELSAIATSRVVGMASIRDLARDLLATERNEAATDAQLAAKRATLNAAYDAFVKDYGRLSRQVNVQLYRDDSDSALLLSLERDYDKGVSPAVAKKEGIEARKESAKKADLFTQRLNFPTRPVTEVSDAKSAMLASLNELGRLDADYMAGIYKGKSAQEIETELGDAVFRDGAGALVPADLYLSGNVKVKLAEAKKAAVADPSMERNVAALEKVQPADVDPADIFVQVGTPWIPVSDYNTFAAATFEGSVSGGFVAALGGWRVSVTSNNKVLNKERWGHERLGADEIFATLMAKKPIAIYDKGLDDKRILNTADTAAAKGKAEELERRFLEWLWEDVDRRDRLASYYNDHFNTDVRWKPTGEHLTLPGKSGAITLRPHQSAFVYRVIQQGVALADHVVGAGKTFANIAAVMEMRRLGLWRKPMIAVPNHLVDQWAKDFAVLYPGANVLAASRKDFTKKNRKNLFAKIATGDWDAVIVAHSSFGFIPLPKDVEEGILAEEVAEITAALDGMRETNGKKDLSFKDLQKRMEGLQEKIKALNDRPRDDLMDFAEMGIDALSVDEAHEFKNLFFVTSQRSVAGLGSPAGSKKAFDLYAKTRYLSTVNDGKNRVFLTGTPVSNSLAEVFHMQRYLQLEQLKALNVHMFDAWASTFGQIVSDWEMDAAGRFKEKSRFRRFANLPELVTMWRGVVDTVTLADLKRDAIEQGKVFPMPKIKGGKRHNLTVPRSPLQAKFIGVPEPVLNADGTPMLDPETGVPVEQYAEGSIVYRMDNMPKDPSEDNHLKATGDARKASLDYRLVDPDAPDFPGSKINRAVDEVLRIWKENAGRVGTQLVFADLSVPASARGKATQAAQDRLPTWFINRSGAIEHVPGVKLSLSAMPGRQFFSLKTKRDGYAIYEAGSGLYITSGKAKQEAVDGANGELASNMAEWTRRFDTTEIPAERIEAYVQDWQDERDRKAGEETESDDDAPAAEESISMDDLLADQSKHSVYDDVKAKLIAKGIPQAEIAFIHDYNTDKQKSDLFARVNRGEVRVLMGSTAKMGAGMNVQKKLVALHHLDAPWRPSDMIQREGRILRQGNEFYEADPDGFEIELIAYGTQETYDSRQYEIIETKAQGIETFQAGDTSVREIEDISSESASSADMKAAASGNPLILESIKLRKEVRDLEAQQKSHTRAAHSMESIVRSVDKKSAWEYRNKARAERVAEQFPMDGPFSIELGGKTITDPKELKPAPILAAFKSAIESGTTINVGAFRGLEMEVKARMAAIEVSLRAPGEEGVVGTTALSREDNVSPAGFVTRLENIYRRIGDYTAEADARVAKLEREADQAREELKRGFPREAELVAKRERQAAVVAALRTGKREVEGDAAPAASEVKFSLPDAPVGKGMTAKAVSEFIGKITDGWGADAPRVEVVQSADALPAAAKADPRHKKAEGYYDDATGTVYLVAGNLRNPTRAKQVLVHEVVGHYGIEAITGEKLWREIGRTIDNMRRSGKSAALFAEIDRRYKGANRDIAVREAVAVMAEKGVRNSVVDRTVAAVRRFVRALGIDVAMNDAELRQHVVAAARYVRGGARPRAVADLLPDRRQPLSKFMRGEPVASVDGSIFPLGKGLVERVSAHFEKVHGGMVHNAQLGDVLLTRRGVKDSLGHGMGPDKAAAFELVPHVISRGRMLSEEIHYRGETHDRMTIGAPVRIDGQDFLMGAVIRRDALGGTRFYLHEVILTPTKKPLRFVQTGAVAATTSKPLLGEHTGAVETLLQEAYEGKRDVLFSRADPIDSSGFKRWFGQSRVVTRSGTPKVAYHGTADGFWTFDAGRLAQATGHMSAPLGFFFDEKRSTAQRYAENASDGVPADERVIDVYLSIQNPKRMTLAELQAIDDRADAVALRERLKREGYDGIHLEDQGQWIAFEPTQVKSASQNSGGFDPSNSDMRFSHPDPDATIAAVDSLLSGPPAATVEAMKQAFRGLKPENLRENTRPAWLGALALRHLADLGSDIKLRQVGDYANRVQQMATDRNTMQEEASGLADAWESLQRDDRVAADDMANLMHDSTLQGVDPSKAYAPLRTGTTKRGPDAAVTKEEIDRRLAAVRVDVQKAGSPEARQRLTEEAQRLNDLLDQEAERKKQYPELVKRFDALPAAARKVYVDARDTYTRQSDRIVEALVSRINALELDGKAKAAMIGKVRQQFEEDRLNGPYFPLQRFGDFWISAESKTGEPAFYMYETIEAWREAQRELKAGGYTVHKAGRKLEEARSLTGASGGFMADLQALLDTAGVDGDIRDDVYQLYLRTLPELSMRKHQIHRKGTQGYSNDALRAFSANLFHGSFQIARLRHSHELDADLLSMKDAVGKMTESDPETAAKAAALYTEATKRHEWVMNPRDSKVASGLTSLGFAWYLGTTPAAALVNLTQTAIVAFPVLAARFGVGKSFTALSNAMGSAMRSVTGDITHGLPADEQRAFKAWYASGAIDRSQAHNLAGLSETDTRAMNPVARRTMQVVSFMFHKAEVVNREATALAAYRLARESGMGAQEAITYAGEVVTESHFDYSNANRPRWMQSNAAKVLLLFRQYSLNMTWFLWRNAYVSLKGESPQVRVEARKKLAGVLGMTGVFAGALGMPLSSVLFGIANAAAAAFGDDDEDPWDAEVAFRNALSDMLGNDVARIIANGPADYFTGASFSTRVGLDDLWFREPNRELEGKAMANYLLEQAAGPIFGGMLVNTLRGMQQVGEGHTWRGVETMMPKAVKDGMKALRYGSEGVQTMRGDPVIEDLNVGQALLQLAGFAPAELNDRYDGINASRNFEDKIMDRRSSLLNAYAMAWRAGDGDTAQKVLAKIRAFNKKQPEVAINADTIRQSMQARMRYSSRAEGGVVLNPKLAGKSRERGRFSE